MQSIVQRMVAVAMMAFAAAAFGQDAPSAFNLEKKPAPALEEALPAHPEPAPGKTAPVPAPRDIRHKVSRMLLVTLEGIQGPSASDVNVLKDYPPGGVIIPRLFHPAGAKAYLASLRQYDPHLLIGADLYEMTQGAGDAPAPFMALPTLLALAAGDDPEAGRSLATLWGEHLRTMGFNLCLGPRLGLAPRHPEAVGTLHCLGSDPKFAAEAGEILCRTLADQGVLAMPMDFPGGGWNRIGHSPAVLSTPGDLLAETDLRPFAQAIQSGVHALHTGPILAPTLDAEGRPACLSQAVITDLLRKKMGFEGVICAGPVDDPAIRSQYDIDQATLMAIEAGADLVYIQGGPAAIKRTADRLATAIETGQLSESLVDTALARIEALKQHVAGLGADKPSERRMASLENRASFEKAAMAIDRHAITLVQNHGGILPLLKKGTIPVGVTGITGVAALQQALEKYLKRVARQDIVTARQAGDIEDFEIRRITDNLSGGIIVCILDDQIRPGGVSRLISAMKSRQARVVVVHFGYPKNIERYAAADAILLAYGGGAQTETTWKAVAEALTGQGAIGIARLDAPLSLRTGETRTFNAAEICRSPAGRLPVQVSDRFPMGTALSYPVSEILEGVQWDFGDGGRAKGIKATYAYAASGSYTLTFSVDDPYLGRVTRLFSIEVKE